MYRIISDPSFKKKLADCTVTKNIFNVFEGKEIGVKIFILRGRDIRQILEKEEIRSEYRSNAIIIGIDVSVHEIDLLHKVLRIELPVDTSCEAIYQYALIKDQWGNIHQYYHKLDGVSTQMYQEECLEGTGLDKIVSWINETIEVDKKGMSHNFENDERMLIYYKTFIEEQKKVVNYYNDKIVVNSNYMTRKESVVRKR